MHEDVRNVYFKDVPRPLFDVFQRVEVVEQQEEFIFEGHGFICGFKLNDDEHYQVGWWYNILFTFTSVYSPYLPIREWAHESDVRLFSEAGEGES